MKYLYLIATGAAKRPDSERVLWDALKAKGLEVRDIHDLPRIAKHEIAVTDAVIARLVKKRYNEEERPVRIICLAASEEALAARLPGVPERQIAAIEEEMRLLALQDADYCVPSDDLEMAADLLVSLIERLENGN